MSTPHEQHELLRGENDDRNPPLRPAITPPQTFIPRHRPGYARAPSVSFAAGVMETSEDDITQAPRDSTSGLGIDIGNDKPPRTTQATGPRISRVPVGRRSTSEQSSRPLVSPPSTGGFSGTTRYDSPDLDMDPKGMASHSVSSLQSMKAPSFSQSSQRNLVGHNPTMSVHDQFQEFQGRHVCSSARHFRRGMNNWLAITILMMSVFSTIFSAIFLILALYKPRYGHRVGSNGITPSTAAFLTSLFAKMIELSFITVVVAFIGQLLARRAFQKEPNTEGVTLAEISMRSWIVQPGTMLTHWESVRYAAPSLLGFTALIAAIMAMLYTPASTALVQPQLKFSGYENRVLQSNVFTSFSNPTYIQDNCKTPITTTIDQNDNDISTTCIQIEHAAQSFHNYHTWISNWTEYANSGVGSRYLSQRPKGWALFNDNTTITAPWIEIREQGRYKNTQWFINNVTMALPHPGVVSASVDPANRIQQPDQLNGQGLYSIRASVPVPFVNVICLSNLAADELKPIIYSDWDEAKKLDPGNWPAQLSNVDSYIKDPFLGGTPFDDVFEWGDKYGLNTWPPIFPKRPIDYNTLINDTTGVSDYGRNAVYVLGKGGAVDVHGGSTETNYGLCELRVGQSPNCSSVYNASSNVGTLEAICEDPNDPMRYIKSLKNASSGRSAISSEWPNIASMWLRSIDLGTGIIDGNASNARLWTELILTNSSVDYSLGQDPPPMALESALPSPAEALAVMASCTLIQSALDAPFVEFWNYSVPALAEPQAQFFNASVNAQQFASGGQPGYQQGFAVVLFVVFILNFIVLLYFLFHRDWYVDFSDPTNLFSLAINSPPSAKLGDCTCGLGQNHREKFKHYWRLQNYHGHLSIESPDMNEMSPSTPLKKRLSEGLYTVRSPVMRAAGRWGRKKSTSGIIDTPTEELYRT